MFANFLMAYGHNISVWSVLFFFTQMSNIYGRRETSLTNCNRDYIIFTYFFIISVIACESSDTFFVPFGFANGQLVHYFSSVQEN